MSEKTTFEKDIVELKCSKCKYTGPIYEFTIEIEEVICPNCQENKVLN